MIDREEYLKIKNKIENQFNCINKSKKNIYNKKEYNKILDDLKLKNKKKSKIIASLKNQFDKLILNRKIICEDEIPELEFKENDIPKDKMISLRMQQLKVYMNSIDKLIINKWSLALKSLLQLTNNEINKELFKKLQFNHKIKILGNDIRIRKKQISRKDYLINFQEIYFNNEEAKIMKNFIKYDIKNTDLKNKLYIYNKNKYNNDNKLKYIKINHENIKKLKEKNLNEYINNTVLIEKKKKLLSNLKNQIYEKYNKKDIEKKLNNNNNFINKLVGIFKEIYIIIKDFDKNDNFKASNKNNSLMEYDMKFKKVEKSDKIKIHELFFQNLVKIKKRLGTLFKKINNDSKKKTMALKIPNFQKINTKINKEYTSIDKYDKMKIKSYNNFLEKEEEIDLKTLIKHILEYHSNLIYLKNSLKNRFENLLFQKNKKNLILIELNKELKNLNRINNNKEIKIKKILKIQNKNSSINKIEKYFLHYNKENLIIFKSIIFLKDWFYRINKMMSYFSKIDWINKNNDIIIILKKINLKIKENINLNDLKLNILKIFDKYFYDDSIFGLKTFWKYFIKSNIHLIFFIDNNYFENLLKNFLKRRVFSNNTKNNRSNKKIFSMLNIVTIEDNEKKNYDIYQKKEYINSFILYFLIDIFKVINNEINYYFSIYKEFFIILNKSIKNFNKNTINILSFDYNKIDSNKNINKNKKFSIKNKLNINIKNYDMKMNQKKSKNNSIIINKRFNNSVNNKNFNFKTLNKKISNNSNIIINSKKKLLINNCDNYRNSSFNNKEIIQNKNMIIKQSTKYSKIKNYIKNNDKNKSIYNISLNKEKMKKYIFK